MKVFDRPFFKKVAGSKGSALGRARRREISYSPFFWFFFCGYLLKKRTERFSSMLHILTLSILFLDTAGAKKRIKRNAEKVSPVATGDLGLCPKTPVAFCKKRRKNSQNRLTKGGGCARREKSPSDNVRGAVII